jgi:hypothetical protein
MDEAVDEGDDAGGVGKDLAPLVNGLLALSKTGFCAS